MSVRFRVRQDTQTPFPSKENYPGVEDATVDGDHLFEERILDRVQRRVARTFPYDGLLAQRAVDRYFRVCRGLSIYREDIECPHPEERAYWEVEVAYRAGLEEFLNDLRLWLEGSVYWIRDRETGVEVWGILASDEREAVEKFKSDLTPALERVE